MATTITLQIPGIDGFTIVEIQQDSAAAAMSEVELIASKLPGALNALQMEGGFTTDSAEAKHLINEAEKAKTGPAAMTEETIRLGDEKVQAAKKKRASKSKAKSTTAVDDQHKLDPNVGTEDDQPELPLEVEDGTDEQHQEPAQEPPWENEPSADDATSASAVSDEQSKSDSDKTTGNVTLEQLRQLITASSKEGKAAAKAFITEKVGKPSLPDLPEAEYPALKAAVEEAQS